MARMLLREMGLSRTPPRIMPGKDTIERREPQHDAAEGNTRGHNLPRVMVPNRLSSGVHLASYLSSNEVYFILVLDHH